MSWKRKKNQLKVVTLEATQNLRMVRQTNSFYLQWVQFYQANQTQIDSFMTFTATTIQGQIAEARSQFQVVNIFTLIHIY